MIGSRKNVKLLDNEVNVVGIAISNSSFEMSLFMLFDSILIFLMFIDVNIIDIISPILIAITA